MPPARRRYTAQRAGGTAQCRPRLGATTLAPVAGCYHGSTRRGESRRVHVSFSLCVCVCVLASSSSLCAYPQSFGRCILIYKALEPAYCTALCLVRVLGEKNGHCVADRFAASLVHSLPAAAFRNVPTICFSALCNGVWDSLSRGLPMVSHLPPVSPALVRVRLGFGLGC